MSGRGAELESDDLCRFGSFVLDCRTYVLSKGKTRVRLPHSLIRLLVFFLEREGELITRKQIAAVLWQEPHSLDVENGINTAVNRLRAALGDSPSKPAYIETVIGAGYRFVVKVHWVQRTTEKSQEAKAPSVPESAGLDASMPDAAEPKPSQVVKRGTSEDPGITVVSPVPESGTSLAVILGPVQEAHVPTEAFATGGRRKLRGLGLTVFVCAIAALCLSALLLSHRVSERGTLPGIQEGVTRDFEHLLVQATFNAADNPITASSVSADGSMLAFSDSHGLTVRHIERNADIVISFPRDLQVRRIAWLSDEKGLLVSCDTAGGNQQIWAASIAPAPARLILDDAADAAPSRDGKQIAFTRFRQSEIWIATAGGLGSHRIVVGDAGTRFSDLAWLRNDHALFAEARQAPEAEQVAGTGGADAAYRSNVDLFDPADGKLLWKRATPSLAFATLLWEEKLLFVAQVVENNRTTSTLRLMTLRGDGTDVSKTTLLAHLGNDEITGLSASADGKVISVIRKRRSPAIYFGQFDSHQVALRNISNLNFVSPDTYPHAWSPSGDAVFFEADPTGPYAIYKQTLDGSPAVLFARSPGDSAVPQVTPDGRWVIFGNFVGTPFRHIQGIYKVPIGGGRVEQLPTSGEPDSFDCSVGSAGRCMVRNKIGAQFVYYALDPILGQGKELLRTEWSQGMLGSWTVSSDGQEIVTIGYDSVHPTIHLVRLDGSHQPVTDTPILTSATPISVREALPAPGYFIETRSGDENGLGFVSASGKVSVLKESSLPIWGVPSRNGKLAFPFPTIHTDAWLGKLPDDFAR